MNLCIPYNVIEPIIDALSSQNWFNVAKTEKSNQIRRAIELNLNESAGDLNSILAETSITLNDLISLSIGDIIVTERPASSPVDDLRGRGTAIHREPREAQGHAGGAHLGGIVGFRRWGPDFDVARVKRRRRTRNRQ